MVGDGAVPLQMVCAVWASQLRFFSPRGALRSLKVWVFLLMDTQTTLTTEDSMGCLCPQLCLFLMGASSQTSVLSAAGQGNGIPMLAGPSFF